MAKGLPASELEFQSEDLEFGDEVKDAPNQAPHDDNLKLLGTYLKAVYGLTPGGKIAQTAAPYLPGAAKAGAEFLAEEGDILAGAAGGAMAAAPLAPLAGPLAPLVPIGGAAIGATAARGLVRPAQMALGGRPVPETVGESVAPLAEAGRKGALQELGGQAAAAGMKMGIEGAIAGKAWLADKAKKVLPDFSQIMLRIPSESINRTLSRFKDFSPSLKATFQTDRRAAQAASERIGAEAVENVGNELNRARKIAGVRLGFAEKRFISRAGDIPVSDINKLSPVMDDFVSKYPELEGSADLKKIENAVMRYVSKENQGVLRAKDAIALRRELDRLRTFNQGGIRPIENDPAAKLAADIAGTIRADVLTSAKAVGGKANYAKRLEEFSTLADKYDEAIEAFKTASGSDRAAAKRFDAIASEFNRSVLSQEALSSLGAGVRGGERINKAVEQLFDAVAAREFSRIPAVVPSSVVLRLINVLSPARKGAAMLAGATGPAISPVTAAQSAAANVAGRIGTSIATRTRNEN